MGEIDSTKPIQVCFCGVIGCDKPDRKVITIKPGYFLKIYTPRYHEKSEGEKEHIYNVYNRNYT